MKLVALVLCVFSLVISAFAQDDPKNGQESNSGSSHENRGDVKQQESTPNNDESREVIEDVNPSGIYDGEPETNSGVPDKELSQGETDPVAACQKGTLPDDYRETTAVGPAVGWSSNGIHCMEFRRKHPQNFDKTASFAGMSLSAMEKTIALVIDKSDIFITSGTRSIHHPREANKKNPKCAPHVLGVSVDVRPGSTNGNPTKWNDPVKFQNYDRLKTQIIVYNILQVDPKAKIFFNDPKIVGVTPAADHDDHIHVTWSLHPMDKKFQRKVRSIYPRIPRESPYALHQREQKK
ncbi:MAG: hypothetical protein HY559_05520 [Gammaproteobacteria bacterium]|nr:hypothetical protein [Gammaproteobacteria bacterium]